MIKAIIFDLGGVLIDNPTKKMFSHYCETLHVSDDLFLKSFLKHKNKWQTGKISEKIFWKNITSELKIFMPKNKSLWLEGFVKAFKKKKEMFELINTLKQKNYTVALLSNTEKPIEKYIKSKNFKNIDLFICSCEVGISKPNEEIYKLILEKLGIKSNEALFIDDREDNIISAKYLGIHGILFKNPKILREEMSKLHIL